MYKVIEIATKWTDKNILSTDDLTTAFIISKFSKNYRLLFFSKELEIIKQLKLEEYSKNKKAFSFRDPNNRKYIFINDIAYKFEDINPKTLLHEIGHHELDHSFEENNKENTEADVFAYSVISRHQENSKKHLNQLTQTKKQPIIYGLKSLAIAIIIVFMCSVTYFLYPLINEPITPQNEPNTIDASAAITPTPNNANDETENQLHSGEPAQTEYPPQTIPSPSPESTTIPRFKVVYYTPSGTVYHCFRDCYHIKNNISVQSGSIATSNKSRLCKDCEIRLNN